jgi:hypothetical protein
MIQKFVIILIIGKQLINIRIIVENIGCLRSLIWIKIE